MPFQTLSERDVIKAKELYLKDWKDITEISTKVGKFDTRPSTVERVLYSQGIESESLEEAVEQRANMALHNGMSHREALEFIRPDADFVYNKRNYRELINSIGIYDEEDLIDETDKYLNKHEIDEVTAAYWLLKKESLGITVDDLTYFFNEGLNYNIPEDKPSSQPEVIEFLESRISEEDNNWFYIEDEYLFPSLSESAEASIGELEESELQETYDELTK